MSIQVKEYGVTSDGQQVKQYILTNKNGMKAVLLDYGAVVTELHVPDRNGDLQDVVWGDEGIAGYEVNGPGLGSIIGRNANRIGGAKMTIHGKEYELLLTTKATKEIAGRYGGLENLGDKLMKSENFEEALGEIVWLITLLANQSVLIHNLKNKDNKKELLTEEMVELLTSPHELTKYKDSITEALFRGTKRNIESEPDTKNTVVE